MLRDRHLVQVVRIGLFCFAATCANAVGPSISEPRVLESLSNQVVSAQDVLRVDPMPKWVLPLQFEWPSQAALNAPGEDHRLLLWDEQINAETLQRFFHSSGRILSSAGCKMALISRLISIPHFRI